MAVARSIWVLKFPRHSDFKTILSIDGGGLRGLIPGEHPGLKFSHLLMHLSMSKSGRGPLSNSTQLTTFTAATRAAGLLEGVEEAIKNTAVTHRLEGRGRVATVSSSGRATLHGSCRRLF